MCLPRYFEHLVTYPNSLLVRFYGMHRISMPQLGNRKVRRAAAALLGVMPPQPQKNTHTGLAIRHLSLHALSYKDGAPLSPHLHPFYLC